jgi:N-acyl-D-amino-acid deacylase
MLRRCIVLSALTGLGLLAVTWHPPANRTLAQAAQKKPAAQVAKGPGGLPMTGKAFVALAPLDVVVEQIMLRHGIPGASVAVTREGKLVCARGYGWANYESNEPATPTTLFGLASVSKCFTALAILKLVEEGKLRLDQKAFALVGPLKPPPGARVDSRIQQITVRQLLNHSGGWDRDKSGDPINWSFQVSRRLGVSMPINEDQLIRFMLGVRLDFSPGTRQVYSNFGYVTLGQIVARVSGQSYERYVRARVLEPMGIKAMRMHDTEGRYFQGEARRYNAGQFRAMPPYNAPWTDASGGWAASAVDLARMLTALDGSRTGKPFLRADLMKEMLAPPTAPLKPRPDGTWFGLGWDLVAKGPRDTGYQKGGSWPGVRSTVKHRVDGINSVLLYNAIAQIDHLDLRLAKEALREIQEAVEATKVWPKVDLFDDYR